jgi:GT2 family glycosyltransferase
MGVRVIVPAYGAAVELEACLESLAGTLPAGVRVLLADDASPGDAVAELAQRWAGSGRIALDHVRRPRNLGFVGNVNEALREIGRHDAVLLNSDTIVTRGWLECMLACAANDARIASITPWSNNAEICSFPEFCRSNALPTHLDRLSEAAMSAGVPEYPELPTGVGFCLFLRRAALDAIGDFDQATFGRGYGEENDWCLRATGHGWRHVLCDNAYVAHRGGASFGPEGLAPGGENLARLNARYPGYNAAIAEFIMRDPLRTLRERLARRLEDLEAASSQRDLFD